MNDVRGPAAAYQPDPRPAAKPLPAQTLHGTSALASGGVLDLRQPKPRPSTPTVAKPASFTDIAPASKPQPSPILVVAPQPAPPEIPAAPQPTPAPRPQPTIKEVASQLRSPAEEQIQTKQPALLRQPIQVGAAALAVVIMSGYIWIHNYNNVSIRTASQRAGIVASLPHYTPSGYKLNGPISYGTGFVSFNLTNNKQANKNVAIIQRKSDWDSASLLELYVSPKTKDYVAVDTQGLKIYLYGNGQATWVNKGLQYVVQANSSLSRDQIVKLAESL